jgi:hypothetical protein
MQIIDLTYSERYKIWFSNNYSTGMEFNPDIKPDFDNKYWEPTPIKKIILDDKTIYLTKTEWRDYLINKTING